MYYPEECFTYNIFLLGITASCYVLVFFIYTPVNGHLGRTKKNHYKQIIFLKQNQFSVSNEKSKESSKRSTIQYSSELLTST